MIKWNKDLPMYLRASPWQSTSDDEEEELPRILSDPLETEIHPPETHTLSIPADQAKPSEATGHCH